MRSQEDRFGQTTVATNDIPISIYNSMVATHIELYILGLLDHTRTRAARAAWAWPYEY